VNLTHRVARATGVLLLLAIGAAGFSQQTTDQVYDQLRRETIWVHPSAAKKVDVTEVNNVAKSLGSPLKVLVVPQLGGRWVQNRQELRGRYAEWLFKNPLKMTNGTVIVLTKSGVAAFNPAVSKSELGRLSQAAARLATSDSFTPAISSLAVSVNSAATSAKDTALAPVPVGAQTKAAPSAQQPAKGGVPILIPILGLAGLGIGGYVLVKRAQKQAKIDAVRRPLIQANEEIINGISYLDSYDGLLMNPADNERLRRHRESANDAWMASSESLRGLNAVERADPIRANFETALREVQAGKNIVAEATGESQTAFALPASLAEVDQLRAPLFDPRPGVCYFSGQYSDQLRPVEMAINGQRRTVMASPEAIDGLQSGRPPQIAGDDVQGRFMPWYRVPNYDPQHGGRNFGGFGSGSFFGDMLMFSALSSAFNGWGHSGGNTTIINNYGDPNSPDAVDNGNFDMGGNFDSGTFDSGGGFDFGGGDGGGFDGGGDFGGSFD
jgi:hypothetical protein